MDSYKHIGSSYVFALGSCARKSTLARKVAVLTSATFEFFEKFMDKFLGERFRITGIMRHTVQSCFRSIFGFSRLKLKMKLILIDTVVKLY